MPYLLPVGRFRSSVIASCRRIMSDRTWPSSLLLQVRGSGSQRELGNVSSIPLPSLTLLYLMYSFNTYGAYLFNIYISHDCFLSKVIRNISLVEYENHSCIVQIAFEPQN